ncbi:MAG: hypothetical protein J4F99_00145 [Acidimicrobiia bacterium]|nr:hypothetical protein [Acidimicrobiia bacterium]
MLLWFAGLTVPAVAATFASRALDYRLVIAGAVLPSLALAVDGLWVMGTLLFPIAVLAGAMIVGWGRRLVQRRLLGFPIGLFCHLILDGAWLRPASFWWPLAGVAAGEAVSVSLRPLWAVLAMEFAGAVAIWWSWRRFGLADPARRRVLARRGRLEPASRPRRAR